MNRRTFDTLLSLAGLALALLLAVGGGLLTWASTFVGNQVHDQLAAQQIFFPEAGNAQYDNPDIGPFVEKYAGQQLLTGAQAEAYADHFIAVHVAAATGGKTYAELSSAAQAAPDDTTLAGQVQTAFKGETLRGLLLNAYAFGTMGVIAGIAALVAFVGAAVFLILGILGFVHRARTPDTSEIVLGAHTPARVEA